MAQVLVVDDDESLRRFIRQVLEREGHAVDEAENGARAIERIAQGRVDLVITDLIMPEKEGIETIMEVRQRNPEVRIIAMSGGGRLGPDSYLDTAQRLGADRSLAKPFQRHMLVNLVSEVLAVKREA